MTSVFPHRTTRYDKTAKLQRQRRHAALNAEMDRALTRPSKADLYAMLAQAWPIQPLFKPKRPIMLDRQYGKLVVECDACGDMLETDTKDFHEARDIMQREGWKIRKEGEGPSGVWLHGCTKCGVPSVGLFARNARTSR